MKMITGNKDAQAFLGYISRLTVCMEIIEYSENWKDKWDQFVLESFEAGVALSGWEVKSLRMGKADLGDSYVLMKNGEAWLLGAHIIPLDTASTHFVTDPTRTRKLLLHKKELAQILAATSARVESPRQSEIPFAAAGGSTPVSRHKEVIAMTEELSTVSVGHLVPDFELTTYDPIAHDFSKFSLAEAKAAGKWTILFFYPADFTFV